MSPGIGKSNIISRIVRIRQMLRRWRTKAASSTSQRRIAKGGVPPDVPAGHVVICVGSSRRRFVVRATYLNHPIFQKLLVQTEEEYGFANQGPLVIPCEESIFEEVLRLVSGDESSNSTRCNTYEDFQRCCHVDYRKTHVDVLAESQPLLGGYAEKTIVNRDEAPHSARLDDLTRTSYPSFPMPT